MQEHRFGRVARLSAMALVTSASCAPAGDEAPGPGASDPLAISPVNGAVILVQNACSGQVLDVSNASTVDGAAIIQWSRSNRSNQQWKLESAGAGTYVLVAQQSGKVADVTGAATASGTRVVQWARSGHANQQWTFTAGANGYYRISPVHAPGLALAVTGTTTAAGAPIAVATANGGCAQQWSLVQAGQSGTTNPAPPTPSVDPSGVAMPTTATRPGFTYLSGINFGTPATLGNVARPNATGLAYSGRIEPYGDWNDNFGGAYRFQKTATVANGVLNIDVHSENGVNMGAAWTWVHPTSGWGFTYGAVEQRVRVTGNLGGYGSASLLWPGSDVWADGEIDYPEADFGGTTNVFHHCLGANAASNCSYFNTGKTWAEWHTYRIEWRPSGTTYLIDGQVIGTNTNATPTTSHHWVTQIGRHAGGLKDVNLRGNYQVDWVVFERLSNSSP